MKKESKIEKALKFPLRMMIGSYEKTLNEYHPPANLEEAREQYTMERGLNPLAIVTIPLILSSAALYGVAEGGRLIYDKISGK